MQPQTCKGKVEGCVTRGVDETTERKNEEKREREERRAGKKGCLLTTTIIQRQRKRTYPKFTKIEECHVKDAGNKGFKAGKMAEKF
jgi:hypothetical protein